MDKIVKKIICVGAFTLLVALCGCGHEKDEIALSGQVSQTADDIKDEVQGFSDETVPETDTPTEVDLHPFDFTICFAGDISLADDALTTAMMESSENGIYDCISPELVEVMQQADVMCLNNEFTYSTNGSPMAGKAYTFRAKPERVQVLKDLGVDIVGLANNHVYDYGKQALLDTFATLKEAEIPYFGAGENLDEAMRPVYVEIQGKKVAFVAASRAEKNKMTPQATETEPGILRCYDTEKFDQVIEEADANADIVLAYVHWGTEYSDQLEKVQIETAKEYIDAGADAIIGAHPHCLQGIGFYNGVPIFYSLGNYWFNGRTLDTMLVQLHVFGDDNGWQIEPIIVPAIQSGRKTTYVSDPQKQEDLYTYLMSISSGVSINEDGMVREQD